MKSNKNKRIKVKRAFKLTPMILILILLGGNTTNISAVSPNYQNESNIVNREVSLSDQSVEDYKSLTYNVNTRNFPTMGTYANTTPTQIFKPTRSTARNQSHTFTILGLIKVNSVKTDTGSISLTKVEGNYVTVSLSNGNISQIVQTGGSTTPDLTKYVSNYLYFLREEDAREAASNPYYYDDGVYKGSISGDGISRTGIGYNAHWGGYVTAPGTGTDTRTYETYYSYQVTVDYETNTAPSLTITPLVKNTFKAGERIVLEGKVTDLDLNQSIKVTSNMDGVDSDWLKPSPLNGADWWVTWNSNNIKEGKYLNTKVTATDGVGGSTIKYHTGEIIIDRTPPSLSIDRQP